MNQAFECPQCGHWIDGKGLNKEPCKDCINWPSCHMCGYTPKRPHKWRKVFDSPGMVECKRCRCRRRDKDGKKEYRRDGQEGEWLPSSPRCRELDEY
jgi:hypothetical protein